MVYFFLYFSVNVFIRFQQIQKVKYGTATYISYQLTVHLLKTHSFTTCDMKQGNVMITQSLSFIQIRHLDSQCQTHYSLYYKV